MKMNLGIAALLYFGVPIVGLIVALNIYAYITGDYTLEVLDDLPDYAPDMYLIQSQDTIQVHMEIILIILIPI
jgi:hypothetical protein